VVLPALLLLLVLANAALTQLLLLLLVVRMLSGLFPLAALLPTAASAAA
jgi:hypothetical protein